MFLGEDGYFFRLVGNGNTRLWRWSIRQENERNRTRSVAIRYRVTDKLLEYVLCDPVWG